MHFLRSIDTNRIQRNPANVVFGWPSDNRLALATNTLDRKHPVSSPSLGVIVNSPCMVSASIYASCANQHWLTGRMLISCQQNLIDLVPKLCGGRIAVDHMILDLPAFLASAPAHNLYFDAVILNVGSSRK